MNPSTRGAGRIVIVDDNPNNLRVLSSMLEAAGFDVRPALSGELALRSIALSPPELVLLDIRMPGMDGYETCRRLKADDRARDIPVIFISALSETEDKLAAFQAGGVDYVTKPFQSEEVLARVRTHLQLYRMQQHLEVVVEERTRALELKEAQFHGMLVQTIEAFARTVEKRDPYTAGHQFRVASLADAIAGALGMDANRREGLRLGALIHDIGKISLPAEILSRPGPLNATEMALVRTHSEVGREITATVAFPWPVAAMIHQHHERQDGSGYPRGLQGDAILLEARIIAVADVVDAMASHRPYRPALGVDKALEEIRRGSGGPYDPEIVAVCVQVFEQDGYRLPDVAMI
ncbi:MAG TPA: HD domain-containing phosphohydrolase [Rhodocyclaceae bacterium]|nr:HD domain-containing phosphohydrolase [Rhodocyclaceae bacterium]